MLLLLVLQLLLHRHFGPPSWSLRDAPEIRIADPRVFGKPRGVRISNCRGPVLEPQGSSCNPHFRPQGFRKTLGSYFRVFGPPAGAFRALRFR